MMTYRQHLDGSFWDVNGKKYHLHPYPARGTYLPAGQWHLFTMTYSVKRSEAVAYLNGVEVMKLVTDSKPLRQKPGNLIIGNGFNGLIDDVRVYSHALSSADVMDLYESTKLVYEKAVASVPTLASCDMRPADITVEDAALYDAWLNYRPIRSAAMRSVYERRFQNMVVSLDNPQIQTAAEELGYALRKMLGHRIDMSLNLAPAGNIVLGTPETSALVAELQPSLNLEKIGSEGFVIKTMMHMNRTILVVAANRPAGVVQGVFALIRKMQLEQDVTTLDLEDAPKCDLRMLNHWDFISGGEDSSWVKQSDFKTFNETRYSMLSWKEIKSGNTERIRDWARLLSSAGYNAICPTDVNWTQKNNFLDHLDEVKVMADIFRRYGIKLFWTPNYMYAADQSTVDALIRYVPDFGGYLLKLGSESQRGNPGPETVNQIARLLAPHGGKVIIRAFVYGNHFKSDEKHRSKIAYHFFAPKDGQYDANVYISQKYTPYNYEILAPINPLDGAIKKTRYLSESVTFKSFPLSWVKVRKSWLEFDNHRDGRGSLNKNYISGLLGVTEGGGPNAVLPSPSWISNPINMVNVYGLGRLNWNPDISAETIHNEWTQRTFGLDHTQQAIMNEMFDLANETVQNLSLYSDYRGIRILPNKSLTSDRIRTRHKSFLSRIESKGIGADGIGAGFGSVYATEVQKYYEDPVRGEDFMLAFHFLPYTYKLSNGRTIIDDIYHRHDAGVLGAKKLLSLWQNFDGKMDRRQFQCTETKLKEFIETATERRDWVHKSFEEITKISPP
jgi:alpha-glucuronidase